MHGMSFKGRFFDSGLKDLVKEQFYTKFDFEKKLWLFHMDYKEELIEVIKDYCLENQILIDDSPEFVNNILSNQIPFSKYSKLRKQDFDYECEMRENKKSIDMIPPKIAEMAYEF